VKELKRCIFLVAAVLALGCSQESDGGKKCVTSSDCDRGTVCVGGKCSVVNCTTAKECAAVYDNTFCWTDNGVCSGIECLPTVGPFCPAGYECKKQLCIETTPACTSNSQCKQPAEKCYNSQCKPKDYCLFNSDCTSGICNFATSTCEGEIEDISLDIPVEPEVVEEIEEIGEVSECPKDPAQVKPWDYLCLSCKNDQDCLCGAGKCTTIGEEKFCSLKCVDAVDCPSGYTCDTEFCRPVTGACSGCIPPPPCETAEKTCNFQTGECVYTVPSCLPCQADYECGVGSRCHSSTGGQSICMPECDPAKFTCPPSSGCKQRDDGVFG